MNTTGEWWEDFFHGTWGRWQAAGFGQTNTEREADFLEAALGLKTGDAVLDVACGTGRHAIELADRGIRVTGIDFNATTLAIARKAAARCEPAPEFIQLDMRCLRFREVFDAAYCFWNSFGYFEDETHDLVVAKRIAEALRPGGRLLLDLHATETLLPVFRQQHQAWLDDTQAQELQEVSRWDFSRGRIESDWTFSDGTRSESWHSSIRLYSYCELCELLREAGFRHFEGYDTRTGEAFSLGAGRLGLVASL